MFNLQNFDQTLVVLAAMALSMLHVVMDHFLVRGPRLHALLMQRAEAGTGMPPPLKGKT